MARASEYVKVKKEEYQELKSLKRRFAAFMVYFDHIASIRQARSDVVQGKVISQEALFKKLGL